MFHKTTLPHDIILAKEDSSISDEQVEVLSIEYNIHYIDLFVSFIYPFSTRVDLCFTVHNLEKNSSNPGEVHFEVLVHLLRYIRYNNNLGLKYYSKIVMHLCLNY